MSSEESERVVKEDDLPNSNVDALLRGTQQDSDVGEETGSHDEIASAVSKEESQFGQPSDGTVSDDHLSDSEDEQKPLMPKDNRLLPYESLTDTQSACINFAMEHRIFLTAILGLLAERDKMATEIGMNDPHTLKSGPLKKASHLGGSVWKVKFVEVRRGMFTYYEDAVSSEKTPGSLLRKNIPLDYHSCSCRPVKIHRNGLNIVTGGAIFELRFGSTRRLWLAKSRAERLAWIQAINDAMVGGSVTQGSLKEVHGKHGSVNSKSPYKKDLRKYLKIKGILKSAKTKGEYIPGLTEILGRPLDIPVQWIMQQIDNPISNTGGAFHEGTVSSGLKQLKKDLLRDSILINLELFHGDNGHGTEKIIGALARNIIGVSRSATSGSSKYSIPESMAFAYARDVLLSINRTRSGGDSYFCIDTLVNNPKLVVTVPSSREAEPLSITAELDETDDSNDYSVNDKSGWIRTRKRLQMSWRKRYFVLSEGTLSFYRNATPRPHGLRGQMVVADAQISVDRSKEKAGYFTLSIVTKDGLKDRYLYFNNEDKLLAWAYALECTAKGSSLGSPGKKMFGLRSPRDSQEVKADSNSMVEQSMTKHVKKLGLPCDNLEDRIARMSAKTSSRVKISVKACTEYRLCTTDPQGDDSDTWAIIDASFLQTFRIIGDRIVRGEEIVRVQVTDCSELVDHLGSVESPLGSSSSQSPRKKSSPPLRLSFGRRRRVTS